MTNPPYYDVTGSTTFPANNAASGTTLTIKIGGTNYDSFSAPSTSGATALLFVEASVSSATAITFSGSNPAIVIASTSPSCVTSGSTFYLDVSAKLATGTVIPIAQGIKGTVTGDAVSFSVTSSTNQFPGSPTIVQLVVSRTMP